MPRFTVTDRSPTASDPPGFVTWRNGTLTGSDDLTAAVEGVVESGVPVSLPGLYYGPPRLDEHGAALATIVTAFPGSTITDGDAPRWEEVPDGAIP